LAIPAGTRFSVYEIQAALGQGGMGEVYRARDTRLNRDVAIKVLPDAFVTDRERVARFEREAQLVAALNHPNIAAIYGLEKSGEIQFLVLELVDGESLAHRIASSPGLSIDEALAIARQLVDALEAAHEKGIVHRDLKPANIMLTSDHRVKVLDFGLAKFDTGASGSDFSNSPTLSFAATQAGVILGTAAYMSPEQAKGRNADKRSDVWAFGCVLYEMLTGRRAFEGEDLSDTLASVIKSEPDWAALPAGVPVHVRTILKGCLAKDRRARIPDLAVVRYLLDGIVPAPAPPVGAPGRSQQERGLRVWQIATALFLVASVVGIPATYLMRSPTPAVARFFVLPPEKHTFAAGGRSGTAAVISPDGRRLAFTARDAAGRNLLWIRPIDSLTAQTLAGTDGAAFPFWSPDSRFIGYFSNNRLLKIDVTGGPPQTVCTCNGRGATWSRDGVIVLNNGQGPLHRVSSAGGEPSPFTRLVTGQQGHGFPSFLPDGRHVLYYASASAQAIAGVYVASLDTGETKRLLDASSGALYAASAGYLLFVRDGTLLAQPFDAKTLTLSSEPLPVAERVESTVFPGVMAFSVSETGVLAYGVGSGAAAGLAMVWVDRQGKAIESVGAEGNYRGLDLAPDGKRIAAHRHDGQGGDVWIFDLSRGTTPRLTFDSSQENASPIWSPDGLSIVFSAVRNGKWSLYQKPSNGAGTEERLVESDVQILPTGWAPGGQSLVYGAIDPKTRGDLWQLPLSGDRKAVPLLRTPFNESHAQISPDSKWFAYYSDESGLNEVYVRPFPSGAGKWQISTSGGQFPRWRSDGHELFYMSQVSYGKLMAVDVRSTGATFEAGTPKALFDSGYLNLAHSGFYHTYAVSPDGQRFLIPRPPAGSPDTDSSPIVVVLNWAAGLR
jgi:Tol biopolymer transport system component